MHQLEHDPCPSLVHLFGNRLPGGSLFGAGDARLPGVALAEGGVGIGAFDDGEPETASA